MGDGYARRQIENWRRTRMLATVLANIHRGKDAPAIQPADIMELPGDPPAAPPMSEAEFEATMARLAQFDTLQPA